MSGKYGASALRQRYESEITAGAAADLTNFKSKRVNHKLGYWDPTTNGVRYLKELIWNLAAGLGPENRERLRRIRNRHVGDPVSVRYDGERVCLDSLLSVFELEFLSAGLQLDGARVLEIGGGYGRTAHAMLSNHEVAEYWLVDLPASLELASAYLRAVLDDDQFSRLRFVVAADVDDAVAGVRFDLGMNINSFAEMPPGTVRDYLQLVAERCAHFYLRDPVGKYLDPALDGHAQGRPLVDLAMSTGLLLDVIDVHDSEQVAAQARKFVAAYRPADGWEVVADRWSPPWSFYWQVLYRAGT